MAAFAGGGTATTRLDTSVAISRDRDPLGHRQRRRYVNKHAAELVALAPDVILAAGGTTVGPLLQTTRTVPIVFVPVTDPVGGGFVASLARPGGNTTGFMSSTVLRGNGWNCSSRSRRV